MNTLDTHRKRGAVGYVLVFLITAVGVALVTALLMNIFERKSEAKNPYVRLVEVISDHPDEADIGKIAGGKREVHRRAAERAFAAALQRPDRVVCYRADYQKRHYSSAP